MNTTGVVRRIDQLGRFVIPKEIREKLNMANNAEIEIFVEDDAILLKKFNGNKKCIFCSSDNDVKLFKGKYICNDCLMDLNNLKKL